MNDIERLLIESACAAVVNQYGLMVNRWDLDGFVSLFVEDAVWQRPGVEPYHGHDEIRAFMQTQPATERVMRHVQGGIVVEVIDESTAKVLSQTTVYDVPLAPLPAMLSGPDMVVEYEDIMVKVDSRWLIKRRDTTQVFSVRGNG